MEEISPETKAMIRSTFKSINRFMIIMWQLGLGSWINIWPEVIGRIMVITHTGRKSGVIHHTPVNYAVVDGEIYCVSGFGEISDWYRNISAFPEIEIWLPNGLTKPDSWWKAVAEDISDSEIRLKIIREVMVSSGFVGRLMEINPYAISDQDLFNITKDYSVVHIVKSQARMGNGGPAEYAWVWPIMSLFLLLLLFLRPKRIKV